MPRLPKPGQDNNTWGTILNDYLSVSHTSTGTLNSNVVGASQLQSSSVTTTKLDSPTQTSLTKADSSVQTINTKSPSGSGAVTLTATDLSAVPTTRQVNGKALSTDITLNASDVNAIGFPLLGSSNGVATLDSGSKLTSGQLPSLGESESWFLSVLLFAQQNLVGVAVEKYQ